MLLRCGRTGEFCTNERWCVVEQKNVNPYKCEYAIKDKQSKLF